MDGVEGKKLKNGSVVEDIEPQRKMIVSDEIRDNEENSSPMSNNRLKQGSEEKWGNCPNVSKTIKKQSIEGSLGYCANGKMGISSHMSKNRSNKGSEDKWRDCSNVSKTTEKKGIEGRLGYCDNGPMGVS